MLDRLTGKSVHLFIHLLSCILLAGGLPTSKIPLSLGTILLLVNVLLEADFKSYWQHLKTNRVAWGLWLFIGFEWISLFWTHDFSYASHDFRAKLPLYVIPLVLVIKPITERKHLYLIISFFLASLFVTSFINIGSYLHWWGDKVYDDIRGLSLFSSHIRYALMIGLGIAFCITWIQQRLRYRIIPIVLGTWWLWYTYFSQIISGYVAIFVIVLIAIVYLIYSIQRKTIRWSIIVTTLVAFLFSIWWVIDFFQPTPHKVTFDNIEHYSVNGNWYTTEMHDVIWENGYPVVAYISEIELEKAWNQVSDIDYAHGTDKKEQPLYFTLWRYMASKGLRKDSVGFCSMTKADIVNVESGVASICLTGGGFKARLYGLKHQFEHPENPNGHSLLQRLEYWKAAQSIIRENWILGVGSGDVDEAFKNYYAQIDTRLLPELQHRAHNQFLTSWISSGLAGLIAFICWWLLAFRMSWQQKQFIFTAFIGICLSSFLIEDTLETQMGVTFVALFYGLFVGYYQSTKKLI